MSDALHIESKIFLNDGNEMPLLGFGTGSLHGDVAYHAVAAALEAGVRHIDTAWWYRNEQLVGRALADSGIARESVFLTTKIWPTQLFDPLRALRTSLDKLGTGYVDLLLIHRQFGANMSTWHAMEEAKRLGLARSIGVSNFGIEKLKKFIANAEIPPAVNQVRCSPLYYPKTMHEFCIENGVVMSAYSPLTRGNMDQLEGIEEIALSYGKSPAQILLRWALQQGIPVLPRAERTDHIQENTRLFDFELTGKTMQQIAGMNKTSPQFIDRIKLLF